MSKVMISRTMVGMVVVALLLLFVLAVQNAEAACGDVKTLASCLPSAQTGSMPPATCCEAMVAYTQGGTPGGETCLCQAVSNPLAKSYGANPHFAAQIPQKCKLNYKAGFVCNGKLYVM